MAEMFKEQSTNHDREAFERIKQTVEEQMRNGYYNFSIETIEEVVRLLGTVFIRNIGTSYYRETLKLVTAIAHLSWENFTERLVWRVEISIYL